MSSPLTERRRGDGGLTTTTTSSILLAIWIFFITVASTTPHMVFAEIIIEPATQQAFDQFLASTKTGYDPNIAYGSGPEFAEEILHEARFKFALESGHDDFARLISFKSLERDQVVCRMDGYLEHCPHPFAGDASKTDIDAPFELDFVVYDEPFEFSDNDDQALIQNYPLFVLGVSAVFNIPGLSRLVLDKPTLSKIFRGCDESSEPECLPGSIRMWNDSAIKATNPPAVHSVLDAAGPIKVVVESMPSSSTAAMKRALASFDEDFAAQIGDSADSSPVWNGTNHIKMPGAHGVLYKVGQSILVDNED